MQRVIKYTFVTIGAYLLLQYATNFGKDVTSASTAGSTFVKTLQGRA